MSPATECSVCHRKFAADQTIQYDGLAVCADCKPTIVQRLREGAVKRVEGNLASLGARFSAKVIDLGFCVVLLRIADNTLFYPIFRLIPLVPANFPLLYKTTAALHISLLLTYQIGFLAWRGQTIGKIIMRVRVIASSGKPPTILRATARSLAEILSGGMFFLGYLLALLDRDLRTLHDSIANTKVTKAGSLRTDKLRG